MTQTKVPTELLLHIISYLTPNEKQQGLLICKDWYEAFRYSLYNNVTVQNISQLKILFKSLLCSNHYNYSQRHPSAIPNGHLMRGLVIHKRTNLCSQKMIQEKVIMPRILFDQLPDLCPNLEVLDFDPETWKFICYHNSVSKWKRSIRQLPTVATIGASLPFLQCLGDGLVSLSIQSGMILDISTQSRLSSILLLVPNVTELIIQGDGEGSHARPTTLSLTMPDLELIHKLLPRLESFKIIGDNIQMPIGSTSTHILDAIIENLPTALELKTLHWSTPHTPPTWVHYVTHKYPSLQTLTLALQNQHKQQQQQHLFTTQQAIQEETLLYTRILDKCPRLEKISLACPRLTDWFNSSFFQILGRSSCIKQVCPIMQKGNQIRHDAELALAVQPTNRHLITALEIEQWRLDTNLPCTLNLLKNLTRLIYLELKCDSYHTEYNVDTLLNSCPQLTSLILEWGSLSTPSLSPSSSSNTMTPPHHPLQKLTITYVAFSPGIFHHLSNRCRSLSRLLITKCKQLCEIKDASSQTLIQMNMAHNHFDLIMIDGVRLDYSNASVFYTGVSSYIQIAAIEDDGTTNTSKWYHHVGYITIGGNQKVPITQLVNEEEKEIIQDYFSRREQCAFVNCDDKYLETLWKQKTSNALKRSLIFGFIKIKCKSLKNFILDGNVIC